MCSLIAIRPLRHAAQPDIEALLDRAFGTDRHGRTAYRLRAGMPVLPSLSFGAWDGDLLVGSVQCWPVEVAGDDGTSAPLVLVGPIAVLPERQGEGIGQMLTEAAVGAADRAGEDALVLIGDPEYYGRFFGFTADATGGWRLPGLFEPRRLLARTAPGVTMPVAGALGPVPPIPRRAVA